MSLPSGVVGQPALAFTTTALAEIMTACFEGYVIPQTVTGHGFNNRFRRESLDMDASRVFMDGPSPIAIVLVTRRGWTARIAAMGIVPAHRGRGLGRQALGEVVENLRRLGDRRLLLEVIETNDPAVRLYTGLGFIPRRRLVGYRRPARAEDAAAASELVEVDPLVVARQVTEHGAQDLPWIMSPETLAAAAAPALAYSLSDRAFAIVEPAPQPGALALRTLVVSGEARGHGLGRRMISSLAARHPGQDIVISANFPEGQAADFLARAGFEKTPISQFEMERSLVS